MGRILITGGAGFIGHNTALMALKLGHEVHILDNLSTGSEENVKLVTSNGGVFHFADVRDAEKVDLCMNGMDFVIHLAAQVSVPASFEDSESNWEINVNGTANILKSAEKASVQRVIVASSAAVYGLCEDMPLKESSAGDLRSPYAESKMENEVQISEARSKGMEAIAFRFFNVYGPRQNSNGAYAAVISKFISLLGNQQAPTIFGDGGQTRDFIHVDDVSKILLESVEMEWSQERKIVYNVATQTNISLLDLLGLMYDCLEEMGMDVDNIQPNFLEERQGDIRHSFASIESTLTDFTWKPSVSLEAGLKKLMNQNGD
tara:strand:- start:277 stop:1230 length:954 start_codon:yes stop_codon:yes gene_type:complete